MKKGSTAMSDLLDAQKPTWGEMYEIMERKRAADFCRLFPTYRRPDPPDPEFFDKNVPYLRQLYNVRPRAYTIVADGQAIRCETCGHVSFNPNDIREKYCGFCHAYHDEDDRPGRQREIVETIEARNFEPIRGKPPAPVFAGIPDYVMKYIVPPWLRNKT
jgi:hypothetical protein